MGALRNFLLTFCGKAPAVKKVYLVKFAFFSRYLANECVASEASNSFASNSFMSIFVLVAFRNPEVASIKRGRHLCKSLVSKICNFVPLFGFARNSFMSIYSLVAFRISEVAKLR